jgi:poly(3-hydroxyalkanoate) depolymerase
MDTQAEGASQADIGTTGTINVNGQRLHIAIRSGKSTSTPLLLMNGIGVKLELLHPFVDALDPAIEIIRFDVPGVGGSPPPIIPHRFSTLALLVKQMLNQLGYKQVDVLGISWGGELAQQFAFQHCNRCRRLILSSTGTGIMVPGRLSVLTKMATPRRYMDPSYMEKIAQDLYGGDLRSNPEFTRELAQAMRSNNPLGYFYQMWAGVGWTSLPWVSFLRQPTLILAGNDDPLVPLINAKLMQCLIPHSKLHVYNGGHLGVLTHAEELARVIEQFLAYGSSPRER